MKLALFELYPFVIFSYMCILHLPILISVFYEKQVGPAPVLVKAEVPWSARRGTLSEKDRVVKTVKG